LQEPGAYLMVWLKEFV